MCFRTIFYFQTFPVNWQNTAWKKSSHSTVLRNTSGAPKFFLVVVEASNLHHISCTYSNWRKWVQIGPTHSMAIFGRCEKFTSVIAFFVKTFLCTLRHPKITWYHSKANFTYHRSQMLHQCALVESWAPIMNFRQPRSVLKEKSDIFPSIMAAVPVIATGPKGPYLQLESTL